MAESQGHDAQVENVAGYQEAVVDGDGLIHVGLEEGVAGLADDDSSEKVEELLNNPCHIHSAQNVQAGSFKKTRLVGLSFLIHTYFVLINLRVVLSAQIHSIYN